MSEDRERVSKETVGYAPANKDANGEIAGDACGRCINYEPKMWRTSGQCEKVAGPISGRYWCRLFEARRRDVYAAEERT